MKAKKNKRIERKVSSLYSTFNKLGIKFSRIDIRQMIKHRLCPYCMKEVKPKDLSVDHIVPKARGGNDNLGNLHFVCKRCNLLKGNLLEEEFSRLRKFLDDNPDIAPELSRRLRAGGFLYRK